MSCRRGPPRVVPGFACFWGGDLIGPTRRVFRFDKEFKGRKGPASPFGRSLEMSFLEGPQIEQTQSSILGRKPLPPDALAIAQNPIHDPVEISVRVENFDIHPHSTRAGHRTGHQTFGMGKIEIQAGLAGRIRQAGAPLFIGFENPGLWTQREIAGKNSAKERMGSAILKSSVLPKTRVK